MNPHGHPRTNLGQSLEILFYSPLARLCCIEFVASLPSATNQTRDTVALPFLVARVRVRFLA